MAPVDKNLLSSRHRKKIFVLAAPVDRNLTAVGSTCFQRLPFWTSAFNLRCCGCLSVRPNAEHNVTKHYNYKIPRKTSSSSDQNPPNRISTESRMRPNCSAFRPNSSAVQPNSLAIRPNNSAVRPNCSAEHSAPEPTRCVYLNCGTLCSDAPK